MKNTKMQEMLKETAKALNDLANSLRIDQNEELKRDIKRRTKLSWRVSVRILNTGKTVKASFQLINSTEDYYACVLSNVEPNIPPIFGYVTAEIKFPNGAVVMHDKFWYIEDARCLVEYDGYKLDYWFGKESGTSNDFKESEYAERLRKNE